MRWPRRPAYIDTGSRAPSEATRPWLHLDTEADHLSQLYRDRANCEYYFDDLKNQRGWPVYSQLVRAL
jgi:hypothetical protein